MLSSLFLKKKKKEKKKKKRRRRRRKKRFWQFGDSGSILSRCFFVPLGVL